MVAWQQPMTRGAKAEDRTVRASKRERGLALLIGATAFILQLLLSPLHGPFVGAVSASPQSAALTALADLAALTGESNVLCADMGGGQPGAPGHDADCPGLCCHLSHVLALFLLPPAFSPSVPSRVSVVIPGPRPISLGAAAHARSAQPRGPPVSV